jgi:peptide/nickel transport system substrate-binding protein
MNRGCVVAVAAVVLVLVAPASGSSTRRDVVVYGATGVVPGLNAMVNEFDFGSGFFAQTAAVRGAFRLKNDGTYVKDLVTSAHADGRGVSYTISPKAFWYWGGRRVPVTYRDFVYTLQQIDDPKNDTSDQRGALGNLDPTRFTHRGLRQVTFFWRTRGCSGNFQCGVVANWQSLFSQIPAIYPSFALEGQDFNKIWRNCICGSDGKPVADGPFYLASWTPGQSMVLRRNPYWGGTKPTLTEIDLRWFDDTDLTEEAMRQGVTDVIFPRIGQELPVFENVPGIAISTIPSYVYEHLDFREGASPGAPSVTKGASNGLLRAPWMRQAIALGIDRRALIRSFFGSLSDKIKVDDDLTFFPTQKAYRPDFARWDYNPRKALAILKAHCARGSGPSTPSAQNTKIWRCGGVPATFRWTWAASSAFRTTAEQLAKGELKAIGIGVVERPLPLGVIFSPTGLPSGDFDLAEFSWSQTGDPADVANVVRCGAPQNYLGFCSRKVDALLNAAASQLKPAKRTLDFQKADRLLAASLPSLPLYELPSVVIHKSKLVGVVGPPEDWHWRP